MAIKQAAIDRTRPPTVNPGTYQPEPDILAWLTSLLLCRPIIPESRTNPIDDRNCRHSPKAA